ncbi:MAG: 8-amino-7-oxononanoate synthase [Alphaproteobacteria bacterium]|jgi:8-amino-7-oxononanoate synthase
MAFEFLAKTVHQREASSLRRVRYPVVSNKDGIIQINGRHYLNFASNDYLGLSQHEQVLQSYVEGLAIYGSGSGASSVVTGYSVEHQALEEDLCEAVNKPASMLFSSGFAANQAICHALFGIKNAEQPHVIADKYMHASFIQGALDTSAKLARFKHNDMEHAQKLISQATPNSLVATEGVFSMDGDLGNVEQLQQLLQSVHQSPAQRPWLYVDDAHGFGVIGKSGFGSLDCENVNAKHVDVLMGTFGKAFGTSGAFVAGSTDLIEYMVNMSKHYVYSTAISGAQARATRASLALIEQGEERHKLQQNIAYFTQAAKQKSIPLLASNSAIQAIIIGDPTRALTCSQHLADLGLWVPAIRTPTVPKNTDRLRITLSAIHSTRDIDALIDGLALTLLSSSSNKVAIEVKDT